MKEIEKLYKNAGIPKYGKRQCRDSEYLECQNYCFCNMDNKCDKFIFEYPPFTAEKQLEITKFLLKKAVYYDVKDDKYWFYYEECESAGYKPFDEAIAHFINKLWQDLTPEEKEQIKGILE